MPRLEAENSHAMNTHLVVLALTVPGRRADGESTASKPEAKLSTTPTVRSYKKPNLSDTFSTSTPEAKLLTKSMTGSGKTPEQGEEEAQLLENFNI